MNLEAREFLKRHIKVKLERDPDSRPCDVEKWILSAEDQQFNFKLAKPKTLRKFIGRNMKKMKETDSLDRQSGSGGLDITGLRRQMLPESRGWL